MAQPAQTSGTRIALLTMLLAAQTAAGSSLGATMEVAAASGEALHFAAWVPFGAQLSASVNVTNRVVCASGAGVPRAAALKAMASTAACSGTKAARSNCCAYLVHSNVMTCKQAAGAGLNCESVYGCGLCPDGERHQTNGVQIMASKDTLPSAAAADVRWPASAAEYANDIDIGPAAKGAAPKGLTALAAGYAFDNDTKKYVALDTKSTLRKNCDTFCSAEGAGIGCLFSAALDKVRQRGCACKAGFVMANGKPLEAWTRNASKCKLGGAASSYGAPARYFITVRSNSSMLSKLKYQLTFSGVLGSGTVVPVKVLSRTAPTVTPTLSCNAKAMSNASVLDASATCDPLYVAYQTEISLLGTPPVPRVFAVKATALTSEKCLASLGAYQALAACNVSTTATHQCCSFHIQTNKHACSFLKDTGATNSTTRYTGMCSSGIAPQIGDPAVVGGLAMYACGFCSHKERKAPKVAQKTGVQLLWSATAWPTSVARAGPATTAMALWSPGFSASVSVANFTKGETSVQTFLGLVKARTVTAAAVKVDITVTEASQCGNGQIEGLEQCEGSKCCNAKTCKTQSCSGAAPAPTDTPTGPTPTPTGPTPVKPAPAPAPAPAPVAAPAAATQKSHSVEVAMKTGEWVYYVGKFASGAKSAGNKLTIGAEVFSTELCPAKLGDYITNFKYGGKACNNSDDSYRRQNCCATWAGSMACKSIREARINCDSVEGCGFCKGVEGQAAKRLKPTVSLSVSIDLIPSCWGQADTAACKSTAAEDAATSAFGALTGANATDSLKTAELTAGKDGLFLAAFRVRSSTAQPVKLNLTFTSTQAYAEPAFSAVSLVLPSRAISSTIKSPGVITLGTFAPAKSSVAINASTDVSGCKPHLDNYTSVCGTAAECQMKCEHWLRPGLTYSCADISGSIAQFKNAAGKSNDCSEMEACGFCKDRVNPVSQIGVRVLVGKQRIPTDASNDGAFPVRGGFDPSVLATWVASGTGGIYFAQINLRGNVKGVDVNFKLAVSKTGSCGNKKIEGAEQCELGGQCCNMDSCTCAMPANSSFCPGKAKDQFGCACPVRCATPPPPALPQFNVTLPKNDTNLKRLCQLSWNSLQRPCCDDADAGAISGSAPTPAPVVPKVCSKHYTIAVQPTLSKCGKAGVDSKCELEIQYVVPHGGAMTTRSRIESEFRCNKTTTDQTRTWGDVQCITNSAPFTDRYTACADEVSDTSQDGSCLCYGQARFGTGGATGSWKYKDVHGEIKCNAKVFNTTAGAKRKCECMYNFTDTGAQSVVYMAKGKWGWTAKAEAVPSLAYSRVTMKHFQSNWQSNPKVTHVQGGLPGLKLAWKVCEAPLTKSVSLRRGFAFSQELLPGETGFYSIDVSKAIASKADRAFTVNVTVQNRYSCARSLKEHMKDKSCGANANPAMNRGCCAYWVNLGSKCSSLDDGTKDSVFNCGPMRACGLCPGEGTGQVVGARLFAAQGRTPSGTVYNVSDPTTDGTFSSAISRSFESAVSIPAAATTWNIILNTSSPSYLTGSTPIVQLDLPTKVGNVKIQLIKLTGAVASIVPSESLSTFPNITIKSVPPIKLDIRVGAHGKCGDGMLQATETCESDSQCCTNSCVCQKPTPGRCHSNVDKYGCSCDIECPLVDTCSTVNKKVACYRAAGLVSCGAFTTFNASCGGYLSEDATAKFTTDLINFYPKCAASAARATGASQAQNLCTMAFQAQSVSDAYFAGQKKGDAWVAGACADLNFLASPDSSCKVYQSASYAKFSGLNPLARLCNSRNASTLNVSLLAPAPAPEAKKVVEKKGEVVFIKGMLSTLGPVTAAQMAKGMEKAVGLGAGEARASRPWRQTMRVLVDIPGSLQNCTAPSQCLDSGNLRGLAVRTQIQNAIAKLFCFSASKECGKSAAACTVKINNVADVGRKQMTQGAGGRRLLRAVTLCKDSTTAVIDPTTKTAYKLPTAGRPDAKCKDMAATAATCVQLPSGMRQAVQAQCPLSCKTCPPEFDMVRIDMTVLKSGTGAPFDVDDKSPFLAQGADLAFYTASKGFGASLVAKLNAEPAVDYASGKTSAFALKAPAGFSIVYQPAQPTFSTEIAFLLSVPEKIYKKIGEVTLLDAELLKASINATGAALSYTKVSKIAYTFPYSKPPPPPPSPGAGGAVGSPWLPLNLPADTLEDASPPYWTNIAVDADRYDKNVHITLADGLVPGKPFRLKITAKAASLCEAAWVKSNTPMWARVWKTYSMDKRMLTYYGSENRTADACLYFKAKPSAAREVQTTLLVGCEEKSGPAFRTTTVHSVAMTIRTVPACYLKPNAITDAKKRTSEDNKWCPVKRTDDDGTSFNYKYFAVFCIVMSPVLAVLACCHFVNTHHPQPGNAGLKAIVHSIEAATEHEMGDFTHGTVPFFTDHKARQENLDKFGKHLFGQRDGDQNGVPGTSSKQPMVEPGSSPNAPAARHPRLGGSKPVDDTQAFGFARARLQSMAAPAGAAAAVGNKTFNPNGSVAKPRSTPRARGGNGGGGNSYRMVPNNSPGNSPNTSPQGSPQGSPQRSPYAQRSTAQRQTSARSAATADRMAQFRTASREVANPAFGRQPSRQQRRPAAARGDPTRP